MYDLIFQFIVSLFTIATVLATKYKLPQTPTIGLLGEIVWLVWIVGFGKWGLLPLTLVLLWIWYTSIHKWAEDQKFTNNEGDYVEK